MEVERENEVEEGGSREITGTGSSGACQEQTQVEHSYVWFTSRGSDSFNSCLRD